MPAPAAAAQPFTFIRVPTPHDRSLGTWVKMWGTGTAPGRGGNLSTDPVPGQTIEDIARAEAIFIEKVAAAHPEANGKPCVIGSISISTRASPLRRLRVQGAAIITDVRSSLRVCRRRSENHHWLRRADFQAVSALAAILIFM